MEAPRRAGWEWGGGGVLKKRSVGLSRVNGGGIGDKQVKGSGGGWRLVWVAVCSHRLVWKTKSYASRQLQVNKRRQCQAYRDGAPAWSRNQRVSEPRDKERPLFNL